MRVIHTTFWVNATFWIDVAFRFDMDILDRRDIARSARSATITLGPSCNIRAKIHARHGNPAALPGRMGIAAVSSGPAENKLFSGGRDAASCNPAMRAPSPLRPKGMARA
jgi:hypothetical protein